MRGNWGGQAGNVAGAGSPLLIWWKEIVRMLVSLVYSLSPEPRIEELCP